MKKINCYSRATTSFWCIMVNKLYHFGQILNKLKNIYTKVFVSSRTFDRCIILVKNFWTKKCQKGGTLPLPTKINLMTYNYSWERLYRLKRYIFGISSLRSIEWYTNYYSILTLVKNYKIWYNFKNSLKISGKRFSKNFLRALRF